MKIESLPRIHLATLPTPLDELPRLSEALGARVWMKRDDLTGFALGGNKARKLEFLLADAIQQGADVVVTGGGPQSNHARMTAAAARKVGMGATLVFFGNPPREVNGNLLLDELLGAEILYTRTDDKRETDRVIERVCGELQARGRKPYVIPRGGSTVLGCCAYILAVGELLEQLRAQAVTPDWIFITTGSCGTHAGILAGLKYFGARIPVYGITVSRPIAEGKPRINLLVQETAEFLQTALSLEPDDVILDDAYLGAGYGIITPEARTAIQLVARSEGIFLDPVYTGKTMAGLMDLVRRGVVVRGATILFWHTGGAPGIFGHPDDFKVASHHPLREA
ncbi:MAG: D-cysteine desulfhydrase family protein [Chloroflexi bacterium]|nr:D-cysteine desulfhydrase family protein [Chloroflexota bacterium]